MEHQHQHEHQHDHTHGHNHATLNEEDPIQSEQLHLIKVITAFAYYKRHSLNHNHRRRRDYLSLSEHHKKLIPDYLDKVNQVDGRIEENMNLIRAIVKSASMFTEDADVEPAKQNSKVKYRFHRVAWWPTSSSYTNIATRSSCLSYGHGQGEKYIEAICSRLVQRGNIGIEMIWYHPLTSV